MEFPKTKAQLQSYGRLYLMKERKRCVEHWCRILANSVLEAARTNNSEFRFSEFEDGKPDDYSFSKKIPLSISGSIQEELARYFPDSNIRMDSGTLIINWAE